MELYDYTDARIKRLNRQFLRLFQKVRLLNFDELNALNDIKAVYRKADRLAKAAYLDIAVEAYAFGLAEAERAGFRPRRRREIDRDWVLDFLEEEDFVTLYRYAPELTRKRDRLVEALATVGKPQNGSGKAQKVTNSPNREIDKALKYLIMQTTHYADKATAEAELQAMKDAGVKKVMWLTERDDRVCDICYPLDGKVFDIDKTPPIPQHYNCRCVLIPVAKKV